WRVSKRWVRCENFACTRHIGGAEPLAGWDADPWRSRWQPPQSSIFGLATASWQFAHSSCPGARRPRTRSTRCSRASWGRRRAHAGPPPVESGFFARWLLCEKGTSNSIALASDAPSFSRIGFFPKGAAFAWHTVQYLVWRVRNSLAWQVSFEH